MGTGRLGMGAGIRYMPMTARYKASPTHPQAKQSFSLRTSIHGASRTLAPLPNIVFGTNPPPMIVFTYICFWNIHPSGHIAHLSSN